MKRTLYVLGLGIFGIATTEFGIIGILPQLARTFAITIDKAGWLISSFALIIAFSAPLMMLLFSRMDRKKAMALVLAVFCVSNAISAGANSFYVLLLARMLPAFLHPVFWSIALSTAATSVPAGKGPGQPASSSAALRLPVCWAYPWWHTRRISIAGRPPFCSAR